MRRTDRPTLVRSVNERRARWELEQILRRLTVPPTDHKPTIERLARIAAEIREEMAHVGGSFEDPLAATYALLDKRSPHIRPLSIRIRNHIRALDRARQVSAETMIQTTDGPLSVADYYPVAATPSREVA